MADKYGWSLNNGDWSRDLYDSRGAAVEAALKYAGTSSFYTARCRLPVVDLTGLDPVDCLLDCCEDFQIEEAEGWAAQDATGEQRDELTRAMNAAFIAWAEKHGYTPDWWIVEDVREHGGPGVSVRYRARR